MMATVEDLMKCPRCGATPDRFEFVDNADGTQSSVCPRCSAEDAGRRELLPFTDEAMKLLARMQGHPPPDLGRDGAAAHGRAIETDLRWVPDESRAPLRRLLEYLPLSQPPEPFVLLQEIGFDFDSRIRAEPELLPDKSARVPKLLFGTREGKLTFETAMSPVGKGEEYVTTVSQSALDVLRALAALLSDSTELRGGSLLYVLDTARAEDTARIIRSALQEANPAPFAIPPAEDPFGGQGQLRGLLEDGLVGFMVGRELARCVSLDWTTKSNSPVSPAVDQAGSFPLSWYEEFRADLVALELCARRLGHSSMAASALQGRSDEALKRARLGGELTATMAALSYLVLVSTIERATGDVWSPSRSRPPGLLRMISLWRSFEERTGEAAQWLRTNRFDAPLQCMEDLMVLVGAVGPASAAQRSIREFQDSVFLSAFEPDIEAPISELEGMMLDLGTGEMESGLRAGSFLASWWRSPAAILGEAVDGKTLSVAEGTQAIGSTMRILKRLLRGD
jgi:hypothetical protein